MSTTDIPTVERPHPSAGRRWWIAHPRAILLGIFFAVAAVTALAVYAIETNARELERAQANEVAQTIGNNLALRGNRVSSYLKASGVLFSSERRAGAKDFEEFAADLNLATHYRGAMGIGWIAYRAATPQSGTNPSARVTYFVPGADGSEIKSSFDVASDPATLSAMQVAQAQNQPTASGKVDLSPQSDDFVSGFAVFVPSFAGQGNDRDLLGFTFTWFDADLFLSAALQGVSARDVAVSLYDGVGEDRQLLASNGAEIGGGMGSKQVIRIANRDFLLVTRTTSKPTLDPLSMITLMFGISVAVLLTMLARLAAKQAVEDQARLEFFEEQHSIRKSLSRELNHRVKNTLANVLSILALTRRRATGLDEFADSLDGRIRALSATHDLLTRSEWGAIRLADVVDAELRHVRQARDVQITLMGPEVDLAPSDALSFGLAVHELTTNAAKYGALGVPGGGVSVTWSLKTDAIVEVEWREFDGPPVPSERKRGFGTELIEKVIAHELNQPVELEFAETGVRCVMRVPLRNVSEFQIRGLE